MPVGAIRRFLLCENDLKREMKSDEFDEIIAEC